MDRQVVIVSLIGGMKLDLRQAEFAAPEVMLSRFSLVGGTRLAVPTGVRVEVTSFSLIGGRRVDVDERLPPNAPTIRLRAFTLVGGVRVQRTLRRERRRDRRRELAG
jgi:predicted membrane protein